MNRIIRTVVSAASIVGTLASLPAVAQAQPIQVAPPAYGVARGYVAPPSNVAPPARGTFADPVVVRTEWSREHAREHAREEQLRRRHWRECERAYEHGAPPWVLAEMRCPAF